MEEQETVYLKDCLKDVEKGKFVLPIILGKDIEGKTIIKDLTDIENILIAGKIRSGKSIFTNAIIYTLLNEKKPQDLRFVLIDSVSNTSDFYPYEDIPYLSYPLVTDTKGGLEAISWCLEELKRREKSNTTNPKIVIFIAESLYLVSNHNGSESKICQLAKNGARVGIHIIMYSRYGKNYTPKIRKSFNGKVAFAVQTEPSSIAILNQKGAEDLRGEGEMLYKDKTMKNAIKLQAPYVSYEEKELIIKDVSRKECLCNEPNCAKCLLINCQDYKCKIHTEEHKKKVRKERYYPKIKKLIESGIHITPEIMRKKFGMGYIKGNDFLNEFWDDEIKTYRYIYNKLNELEEAGSTLSTFDLQKKFTMNIFHAIELEKRYKSGGY